ncbi:MAG TPA: hypothetical protein VMI54_16335 [Polyangiaceae bacterium]|nr:hypothetical protein [Polyangiaceae bacterium]
MFGDFTIEPDQQKAPTAFGDTCEPDTFMCNGATLQRCSDDRKSWTPVATCTDADHCDPTSAACRPCSPGEWACNGATLESCGPNLRWTPATSGPCASPELCSVSGDRSTGGCIMPACDTPGGHVCDGNRLLRCSAGRDALVLVDRCGSNDLCDASKADAQARAGGLGTCVPPVCLAGTFACDGATLEHCLDDETGWEALTYCDDASSCNPLTGDCTPCSPGDAACSGSELWVCGANGFAKSKTCDAPELCDAGNKTCDPSDCSVPGATRCDTTAGLTALEECGNDRRWTVRDACSNSALCSEETSACVPPACASGEVRCLGQVHQTCSGDLTHWVDDQTCAAGQSCDPDGCHGPCTAGAYRCDGALLELCKTGSWETQNRCATAALCDATMRQCNPPICGGTLGNFMCGVSDQNLKTCSDGRDAWDDFRTCPPGTFCDADSAVVAAQPTCDACQALVYTCDGYGNLHLCSADGTASPVVATCPGGCSVSSDNMATCAQMP